MTTCHVTITTILILLTSLTTTISHRLIRTTPQDHHHQPPSYISSVSDSSSSYCESWKFLIEANDAGTWTRVPEKCVEFVQEYMNGERYRSDSEVITSYALDFAKSVRVGDDGKDVWVFDIDETLLSNLPYYVDHGYGSEIFSEKYFNEWVDLAEAPALPASLRLYTELQQLGFKIFLLTGRIESQRNTTYKNLAYSGYTNYERLLLRGDADQGKTATLYKSEKRQELIDEGYRIHGNSGDQWSDLTGFATGERSFKLPNPMPDWLNSNLRIHYS